MKQATTESGKRLSLGTKLGFGVGDLGGNLFFTVMGFFAINYLTDTVKIPAVLAGIAVMIGKFWDAVTDPMMGYISDRSTFKMGRRRPYLIFGAIPMGLSMWLFFTAPGLSDPIALTVWAALVLCLLNTAYTVVNIPYSSLTPELTDDYNERMSVNGYRFAFSVVGTASGVLAMGWILGWFPSKAQGYSVAGLIFGAVMAITALITGLSVRERPFNPADRPKGFFKSYLAVFKNGHYVTILVSYAMQMTGMGFLMAIIQYYTKYIYHNEGLTQVASGILLGVAMAFIPVSVFVSKKIGKKKTYMFFFLILIVATMMLFLFGHLWGEGFIMVMMGFAGIGVGFGYAPPYAMIPDTIDVEARKTGQRREGAYYGMWTFTSKVGQSLAAFILGIVLTFGSYQPNVEQGPEAIFAMRLLIGPIPALVFLIGAIVTWSYKLDETSFAAGIADAGSGGKAKAD